MKTTYIKPCVNVIEIQGNIMLQTASTDGTLEGLKSGTQRSSGAIEADSKAYFDWEDDEDY